MKTKTEITSLGCITPVNLELYDEKRFVKNYLETKAREGFISKSQAGERIAYLNRAISNYPLTLQLEKLEIEALCKYWAKRYFNEGEDEFIMQRLKYCRSLTSDGDKIIKLTLADLCGEKVNEDEGYEHDGYDYYLSHCPTSWYDSDFAAEN